MAITRYSNFDKTVETIADRNSILNRVDGMMIVVKDAIADPDAGPGKAIYRYSKYDDSWILVSKSSSETLQFITEEVAISDGTVTLSQIPTDRVAWGIVVIDDLGIIEAEYRIEDLTITNNIVSNIETLYNGKKLRLTYAYGSITPSIQSAIDAGVQSVAETTTELSLDSNTLKFKDETGTITSIDLSAYLDDTTNTVSSAVLNDGKIDFTREDGTILSVDVSSLYSDYYTKTETENKILELAPETDLSSYKIDSEIVTEYSKAGLIDDAGIITISNRVSMGGVTGAQISPANLDELNIPNFPDEFVGKYIKSNLSDSVYKVVSKFGGVYVKLDREIESSEWVTESGYRIWKGNTFSAVETNLNKVTDSIELSLTEANLNNSIGEY